MHTNCPHIQCSLMLPLSLFLFSLPSSLPFSLPLSLPVLQNSSKETQEYVPEQVRNWGNSSVFKTGSRLEGGSSPPQEAPIRLV